MTGILNEPIVPNRALQAYGLNAYPSSTGQVLGATAEEAWVRNPTPSIARSITTALPAPSDAQIRLMARTSGRPEEEIRAEIFGALLTPEDANEKFGIAGELTFDRPIGAVTASKLRDMKREELARRNVYRRARGGAAETLAQLGVGFAVSALDPINVASAFVPIVGEARYGLWAARYGTPAARAMKGGIEGAAGAVAIEPIVYGQARAEQADYDAMDSLLNVAFGTALGGGLHVSAGWLGDRLAGRPLPPLQAASDAAGTRTREQAMRGAVAAIAEGRPVRVAEQLPELDPAARAAEAEAQRKFLEENRPAAPGTAREDLLTPGGLAGGLPARDFETGEIKGKGDAARYSDYSEIQPGDRKWIEGMAEEVRVAERSEFQPRFDPNLPGNARLQVDYQAGGERTYSTFSDWFKELNIEGERVSKERVATVARKMLAHEPLGKGEMRLAQAMFLEARARRTQNAEEMIAYRRQRERERLEEIDRQSADDAPYFLDDDRQAAAEITAAVQPTLRLPADEASTSDISAIEQQIEELERQLGGDSQAEMFPDELLGERGKGEPPGPAARIPPAPRPAWSAAFPDAFVNHPAGSKTRVIDHPDYAAAKAGDDEAALRLIKGLINEKTIERLSAFLAGRKPIVVAIHAAEDAGRNRIPLQYAVALERRLGLEVNEDIVQINRAARRGSDATSRLTRRVSFDGTVEPGREYLIVDDHISMGGTIADLRAFIEGKGGRVIGATSLSASQFSHQLALSPKRLDALRSKFPDLEPWWRDRFGYGFEGLTNVEAFHLQRFRSADAIRDSVAAGDRQGRLPEGEGAAGQGGRAAEGETGEDTAAGGEEGVAPPTKASGLSEEEQRFLIEADELIAAAEDNARVYDAAASCLVTVS